MDVGSYTEPPRLRVRWIKVFKSPENSSFTIARKSVFHQFPDLIAIWIVSSL